MYVCASTYRLPACVCVWEGDCAVIYIHVLRIGTKDGPGNCTSETRANIYTLNTAKRDSLSN